MIEHRSNFIAVRGLLITGCLALLASCGGTGGSATSAEAASTNPPAAVPSTPAGLKATPGNAQANLTWSASAGATGYHVKRATASGGPYTQVGTPTSGAYSDSSVTNGTMYYYVVSALDTAGESANSAEASALPAAGSTTPSVPSVPSGLAATPGNGQVSLTWSSSSGATSYHVKRATTSGGPYTQVGAPTSASYSDSSLTNGTTYYYVVSAIDSAGESANSAQVSAVPAVPTPPPTSFGTWTSVTPANAVLNSDFPCGNYGAASVRADTANPGVLYAGFNCQGIWKSTDYGQTWTGPINSGANGAAITDCACGIVVSPSSTPGGVPTIYSVGIRGSGTGVWKSVDGGVNWMNYTVTPTTRQDYYAPVIDPYDPNHLLMTGHEMNSTVESTDGGHTWTSVNVMSGMQQQGGSAWIFFINTGNASTTRGTWLWMAQGTAGTIGTWRTANGGAAWVQVDTNEHGHGNAEIYQPDNNGVVFMAGIYSTHGWGVLRSTDYGQTWTHVGVATNESIVFGTSKNLYSLDGFPGGIGTTVATNFEIAAQPGTGTWAQPGTSAGMTQGPGEVAVVNDGTHNILIGAMLNAGLWRYIEP